jgi:hypothetical protein
MLPDWLSLHALLYCLLLLCGVHTLASAISCEQLMRCWNMHASYSTALPPV